MTLLFTDLNATDTIFADIIIQHESNVRDNYE